MSRGRWTKEKPIRSAHSATIGSAARSSSDSGGRSNGAPGKLTPFSSFSLPPLRRAPTISTMRSPPSIAATRPRILPSSIHTAAPTASPATTCGRLTATIGRSVGVAAVRRGASRNRSPTCSRGGRCGDSAFDAAFGSRQVHQDAARPAAPLGRQPHLVDHRPPDPRRIVGAIDSRAIHAGGDVAIDQPRIARRLGRQRHHDRRPDRAAEQRSPLFGEPSRPFRPQLGVGKRFGLVAADPRQRRRDRIEIGHHVALAAAERRQAERRQTRPAAPTGPGAAAPDSRRDSAPRRRNRRA